MKIIVWIDPNIDGDENTEYLEELKLLGYFNIKKCKTIEEAIIKINEIIFDETIIIISGQLFTKFIDEFKNNLNNICFIPKIIIFTGNKNEFYESLNLNYQSYINNPFYNLGGIQTNFDKIIEFVKNPVGENTVLINRDDDIELSFDYIDDEKKLALPMFYKYLIEFTKNDFNNFSKFLYKNYYDKSKEVRNFLDTIKYLPEIPIELLCKYFSRLYTDEESRFYSDLNKDLRKDRRDDYLYFIKVLYEGVKLKALPLASNNILYRGTRLSNDEIENIYTLLKKEKDEKVEGLPGAIIFSKAFLSFTKDKIVADNFLKLTPKPSIFNKKQAKALFILEKDDKVDYSLSTHADIEKLSIDPREREVLFFPFSSFEIKEIKEIKDIDNNGDKIYEIRLLYLGKYLEKIEKDKILIENKEDLPKTTFKDEILQSRFIKSEDINKNNPKQLIQNYITKKKEILKIPNPVSNPQIHHYKPPYIIRRFKKPEDDNDIPFVKEIYNPPSPPNIPIRPSPPLIKQLDNRLIPTKDNDSDNYIIGKLIVTENDINKNIRIINSFEEMKRLYNYLKVEDERNFMNEKELKENCEIKINGNKMKFVYFVKISKPDIYTIEYSFKKNITKTDFMFAQCVNLQYLNLLNFNTQKVTNMAFMFLGCISLKILKLSNLKTRNVIDMNCMFYGCETLEKLDLSYLNTSNVVNMSRLFFGCKKLYDINLSNFNTQKVNDMYGMFYGCENLLSLDLLNFYTQNVINMSRMFFGCKALKKLDLSNFITNKVNFMNSMFFGCISLSHLNLENFSFENIINKDDMFIGCSCLNIGNIICKNKVNLF